MTQTSAYSYHDRFIGLKSYSTHFDVCSSNQFTSNYIDESKYTQLIRKNLFDSKRPAVNSLNSSQTSNSHNFRQLDINIPEPNCSSNKVKNILSPVKILDVPNIRDDFYLNLIDWHDQGPIGIALNDQVYIYTPSDIVKIAKSPFMAYITSLKFNDLIISVGLSNGQVEIYDLEKHCLIRTFKNHTQKVSAMTWSQNALITGSKDKLINFNDLRIRDCLFKSVQGHHGEVCSLKVKPDQRNVFASGANDNKVLIWDLKKDAPIYSIKAHKGAVKAISWCPWKSNILATGGGNNDRNLKIWGQNMQLLSIKETKSQISGLEWNSKHKCLISSHGLNENQLSVWNWEKNEINKKSVSKHSSNRVLSLIQSKEQDMVCILSSDETLIFFQLSPLQSLNSKSQKQSTRINQMSFDRLF